MRANEFLLESLSPVVFHYTNIPTALKILQSGQFELSSALGSVEQQYMPRNKPYFLSTTRTRRGGYHENVGRSQGVLFELDGTWFNQRYRSQPLDYWGNRDPSQSHHRSHEAEDRVFSSEPAIPIGGVKSVHVLLVPDTKKSLIDNHVNAMTRELLISAKTQGIKTYFYTNKAAWQNMDTRHPGDVGTLTGARDKAWHRPKRKRGYMQAWVELMVLNNPTQLSREADSMRYNLNYTYDRQSAIEALNNDMSNARKPDAGQERETAVKIITYMRQHGLNTIKDFVDHIAEKWQAINARLDTTKK